MKKAQGKRNDFGLVLGLLLSIGLMAGEGLALGQNRAGEEGGEQTKISVRVYNYAQVADVTLQRGEKEATRIFREIGVEITWANCNPTTMDIHLDANCTPPTGPLNLGLRILPGFAIVQGFTKGETMGLAFGNLASVSFRWVREEAAVVGIAPSEILGPAIAHELGHLLLPSKGHSRSGIMRARWSREDFECAPLGTFAFTSKQAQSIRTEVRRRIQEQAAAAGPAAHGRPQTSLATADRGTDTTRDEVPFKLYRDYAIVVRGSVGQRDRLNFLIDTGSSSTVVDVSLARKLHLARSPRKISVFDSTIAVEEAVLPSLQLGPLRVERLPVVVQDLSALREVFSVRIDAVVGIDVLSRSTLTVDYEDRKLIWGPIEPLSDAVSCDPHFPYPTVPLAIGTRTLRVYVDTGAQELALFENRTGAIPGTRVVREESRTTVKGQVVVKTVEFQEVTLGTTHWIQREGSMMEGSLFDGTLGPKWLGAKRIRFDFEHKVISWQK